MSTADLAETESAVLAACLHDPAQVDNAQALGLRAELFGDRGRRALWDGMVLDRSSGVGPDEATLLDRHELSVGPGKPFLDFGELNLAVRALRRTRPRANQLDSYIARLAEQRARVRVASMCSLVSAMVEENEPTSDLIEEAERGLVEAKRTGRAGFDFVRLGSSVGATWARLQRVRDGLEPDNQIRTGIEQLDNLLRLRPSHYSVWAGRPSMGKTQAALSAARNIAASGVPTLIVSVEMDVESLSERIVSAEELQSERPRDETIAWWDSMPLYIDERSNSLDEICSSIRLHVLRHDVRVVVVDYLQIMQLPKNPSREQQIAQASLRLKALTKETGVAMILLAQLNRAVESRVDKRPMMSDLRESGSLEQDADSVLMLYRAVYYDPATEDPHELEMLLRKQRNGAVGTAFAHYKVGGWVRSARPAERPSPPSVDAGESDGLSWYQR